MKNVTIKSRFQSWGNTEDRQMPSNIKSHSSQYCNVCTAQVDNIDGFICDSCYCWSHLVCSNLDESLGMLLQNTRKNTHIMFVMQCLRLHNDNKLDD